MKELFCEIEKQPDTTASSLYVNFFTYEIDRGLVFQYKLLNDFNYPVDAGEIIIGGNNWQNWPPTTNDEQGHLNDENYILNKICEGLMLTRKISQPN